jgi:hypothetical protein
VVGMLMEAKFINATARCKFSSGMRSRRPRAPRAFAHYLAILRAAIQSQDMSHGCHHYGITSATHTIWSKRPDLLDNAVSCPQIDE